MMEKFWYNKLSDKEKQYIYENCPLEIGDEIEVHICTINGSIIEKGVVKDIMTHNGWDLVDYKEYRKMEMIGLIKEDTKILEELIPHFSIYYEYEKPIPKKPWWKFWEEDTICLYPEKEEGIVVIDSTGFTVEKYMFMNKSILSPTFDEMMEKLAKRRSNLNKE